MITTVEYQKRRQALAKNLPEHSLAVIPAATEVLRNGDAHYRFRQDSDFYYLTGFNEPNAILLITGGKNSQHILFNRSRNPAAEQWTGKRLGQDAAPEALGVHTAFPIESFSEQLPNFIADQSAVYYSLGQKPELEQQVTDALKAVKSQSRRGVKSPESICDLSPILSEMRLFKSPAEIECMRRAATISAQAHRRAMKQCKHLKNEHQIEAELIYEFRRQGCQSVAYEPIVASGDNACILHYIENNKTFSPGELILIDAGGEYQNYAADISRTFPIDGHFNPDQRALYELVLRAQKAGIAIIKPGIAWHEVQKIMIQILTLGLCELKILKGSVDELIAKEAYKPFYMHNSGHWLGLDVHDSGAYKLNGDWRPFEPGMVLTVEPGLYICEGMQDVDQRWWGMGIRIEDDILVTADGHENLTAAAPVDIDAIEALMRD